METKNKEKLIELILDYGTSNMDLGMAIKEIGEHDKFKETIKVRDKLLDELLNYIIREL